MAQRIVLLEDFIAQDTETGCQYIWDTRTGITPRMDADGKQICKKEPPNGP